MHQSNKISFVGHYGYSTQQYLTRDPLNIRAMVERLFWEPRYHLAEYLKSNEQKQKQRDSFGVTIDTSGPRY
jgi:hypothetical protein